MRYKVNPLSEQELRQRARNRFHLPGHPDSSELMLDAVPHLLEDLAISKIELEMQNEHLQDTHAKLELALRQSAELFDFAPVGLFRIDAKGAISKSNLVGSEMLHMERASIVGKLFEQYIREDQREKIHLLMKRAADSGENQRCELVLLEAGLATVHVQVDLAPFAPAYGFLFTMIDITERKLLEQQLRDDEERLKFALDAAGDGVWDWNVRNGSVHYSGKLLQLYGYSATEMPGTLDAWRQLLHPDDQGYFLTAMQGCLSGKHRRFSVEQRVRCKDSSWKWILCRGAAFTSARGESVERLIGTHVDITARKQMELHFQNISGMQQVALDSLPNRVALLDSAGLLLQTNAAWDAYFIDINNGYASESGSIGTHYTQMIGSFIGSQPDIEQEAMDGVAEVISGDRPAYRLEYAVTSETMERWYLMEVSPVRNGTARAIVSQQEITQIHKNLGQSLDETHFLRVAQAECARALRYGHPLMVLALGLDQAPDATMRDTVQRYLVRITQDVLRNSDILGHLDEDTFALILPSTTLEGGEKLASRIIASVSANPMEANGRNLTLSVSVGGSQLRQDDSFSTLRMRAQTALNLARDRGGDGVVIDTAGSPCLW